MKGVTRETETESERASDQRARGRRAEAHRSVEMCEREKTRGDREGERNLRGIGIRRGDLGRRSFFFQFQSKNLTERRVLNFSVSV